MYFYRNSKEGPMIIQWVAIASVIFAGIALLFNYFAFKKQQRNAQAILLVEFSSRYLELVDKQKEYREKDKRGEYAVLFLNFLEWFAYTVNNKYLSFEIAEIYQGIIVNWYEKVWIKQEENLSGYLEDQPYKFSELKKLYEKLNR